MIDQDIMSNVNDDLFTAFANADQSWPAASTPSSVSNSLRQETSTDEVLLVKPKRALTSYNLFFRHQRHVLLANLPVRDTGKPKRSHGKIGFADMGRLIGSQWRALDDSNRAPFAHRAAADKERYRRETAAFKHQQKKLQQYRPNRVEVTPTPSPQPMSTPMSNTNADPYPMANQTEPLHLAEEDPQRLAALAAQFDDEALAFFIRAFR
jgi:hypothetical protein